MSELLQAACDEAKAGNMDLKKSVRYMGNQFINAAESPVQQYCYDILQLPITNSSHKKEFIVTCRLEHSVAFAKSFRILEELDPDSQDVTCLS